MLEHRLALIAASLPTLLYLISHSFIHPGVSNVGRLLSSTRFTSQSSATLTDGLYHEASTTQLLPVIGRSGSLTSSR